MWGHVITAKGGVAVHYIDLYEVQDMTTLNEKLTFLVFGEKGQSSDYLFMWASKLKVSTLFIFDNCDELLHKYNETFQNLMKNLVRRSQLLKVMLTAKEMKSFLDSFKNFTLRELTSGICRKCASKAKQQCEQNNSSRNCQSGRKCSTGTASGQVLTERYTPIYNS